MTTYVDCNECSKMMKDYQGIQCISCQEYLCTVCSETHWKDADKTICGSTVFCFACKEPIIFCLNDEMDCYHCMKEFHDECRDEHKCVTPPPPPPPKPTLLEWALKRLNLTKEQAQVEYNKEV